MAISPPPPKYINLQPVQLYSNMVLINLHQQDQFTCAPVYVKWI